MDVYKKIAIIGGTGKAGRYIASKALEKGYHVRIKNMYKKHRLYPINPI